MRNALAPINRAPPEVLSLIPGYREDGDRDEASIKLTHVCRYWRQIFVSCPSLWTRLDCKNVEKTRVCIERSKNSPLEIHLDGRGAIGHHEEVLLLAVPHVKALSVSNCHSRHSTVVLQTLVEHFSRPVPLLEKLKIDLACYSTRTLPDTLFGGDLSSLRELSLAGVLMPTSWGSLENLTTFNLSNITRRETLLTCLLGLFESATRLHDIRLRYSIPDDSNVPPKRIVFLPNLKKLEVVTDTPNSVLLDHLSIPSGASVVLKSTSWGHSPIAPQIPATLDNLHNLSYITTVNIFFGSFWRAIQFGGPSGELYTRGKSGGGNTVATTGTAELLPFLNRFDTSRCQHLGFTLEGSVPGPPARIVDSLPYRLLHPMDDLRTLTLIDTDNLLLALDPDNNPDKIVLCPKLEEITFYINNLSMFHFNKLFRMAEERASRDAKLSTITIISRSTISSPLGVLELGKHVSRVDRKVGDRRALPGHGRFENDS